MKELKKMARILTGLAVIVIVFGQGEHRLAAQNVALLAAAEASVLKTQPVANALLSACSAAEPEVPIQEAAPQPGRSCPLPPTPHFVQYRAFIPADHLVTSVPCWIGQQQASPIPPFTPDIPLGFVMVLGDASSFSTHYRIKEYADLTISTTGPATELPVVPVPSVSYNFEWPSSPISGNIASGDFNPTKLLRCWHEQSTGSANYANVGGSTSSAGAYQASVTFCCSASDPLFTNPVAPIQYNLKVVVNTQTSTATITGSHTCFPSHEIMIGTQVVYQKNPTAVNFARLSYCLIGAMVGATETQVNCTVKLDGVSKCP